MGEICKKEKASAKLSDHPQKNPLPDRARPAPIPLSSKQLFVREIFPQLTRVREESVQQFSYIPRSASHERVAVFAWHSWKLVVIIVSSRIRWIFLLQRWR
jgi:hypothetical protein